MFFSKSSETINQAVRLFYAHNRAEGTENMKLRLNNMEETIDVLDASTPSIIKIQCSSATEMDCVREALTKDALKDFQYLDGEGNVIGRYSHYVLEHTTYTVQDGIYQVAFTVRQLSDTEVRLDALEEGQETQNGAIDELAGIVGGEE